MYRKFVFSLFCCLSKHEKISLNDRIHTDFFFGLFWLPKRRIFGRNIDFIGYSRLLYKYFFGLGYLMRKAATASTPTMDIINTGNNWKLVTATTLKTMTLEFEMVNFAMNVIQKESCSHSSYRWIIMLEKRWRPDLNIFLLKWIFGTHDH